MDSNGEIKDVQGRGSFGGTNVNFIKITNRDTIEQIIENTMQSKNELSITLFPQKEFFKTYLIENLPSFLVIDRLMPFYGNKLIHKTEYLKIHIESPKYPIDKYFLTKYKDEWNKGEDHYLIIHRPVEIVLVEKRSVLRVTTDADNMAYVYASHNDNKLICPVYDLSWNCLSFTSETSMEINLALKKTTVKFSDKADAVMDLEIMHCSPVSGRYRIGCKITLISENDRSKLINFMLSIERQNIRGHF